jgi:hypothetical protein
MTSDLVEVDDDLELDLAWKSDIMSVYNDDDGETVDVPGDSDNGDVSTETRPDIDGWDELTDTQQAIIELATDPTKNWDSLKQFATEADTASSYTRRVLREHVPETYDSIKQSEGEKKRQYGVDVTDEVRKKMLNGKSMHDVGESLDIGQETVMRHAKEDINATGATQPRLEYDTKTGWVPVDDSTAQSDLDDVNAHGEDR